MTKLSTPNCGPPLDAAPAWAQPLTTCYWFWSADDLELRVLGSGPALFISSYTAQSAFCRLRDGQQFVGLAENFKSWREEMLYSKLGVRVIKM